MQTVVFTVGEPPLDIAPVTGFTLVDAGAVPDADVGALVDDATVDASALTSGAGSIRAEIAAERSDVRSVVFELRGPRDVTRTDDGPPFSLFGDDDAAAGGLRGQRAAERRLHADRAALRRAERRRRCAGGGVGRLHGDGQPRGGGGGGDGVHAARRGGRGVGRRPRHARRRRDAGPVVVDHRGGDGPRGPGGASRRRRQRGVRAARAARLRPDGGRRDAVAPVRSRTATRCPTGATR